MKNLFLYVLMSALTQCATAQVTNPVAHFESLGPDIQPVLKWEADINGDGKNEVFLSLKDEHDQDVAADRSPGWFLYIADATGTSYNPSTGIKEQGDDSVGAAVPMIDLEACFVGQVSELSQRAIITMQIDNPRVGESIAHIYAYTIEGNHLKRTKLAEYNPTQANALFDKYLRDGKRTVITPVEVSQ